MDLLELLGHSKGELLQKEFSNILYNFQVSLLQS